MKKNSILIVSCIIIFLTSKLWFRGAENSDLLFLLAPTNWIVELFIASKSVFDSNIGYHFASSHFFIDKSCSGFNFLLISFLMITYALARIDRLKLFFILPLSITIAYLITILANASRIICYLVLQKQNITNLLDPDNEWLHRAEGVLVYLSFLIISYLVLNYIIVKLNNYEKLT